MVASVPLHGGYVGPESTWLLAVVALAGAGAAVLVGLAAGAFVRRQSRPYLLVLGALAALLGRSAVAALTAVGALSTSEHHFLEHGLDVVLVGLVIAAVYHARTVSGEVGARP
jgi:hypothetical protein